MQPIVRGTAIGTLAQIAMVLAGHFIPAVAGFFAVGGMGISALAGWGALRHQPASLAGAAGSGALAGGLCAVIGIAVSVGLGDVPPSLLALGTASSAVTGAIGGVLGRKRS
jgi:hypothetical protein